MKAIWHYTRSSSAILPWQATCAENMGGARERLAGEAGLGRRSMAFRERLACEPFGD